MYAYRVFTVEPGGHTPYHNHPYEHMNYVIEGLGALVNEAGEETPLKAGDKHFKLIVGVPRELMRPGPFNLHSVGEIVGISVTLLSGNKR